MTVTWLIECPHVHSVTWHLAYPQGLKFTRFPYLLTLQLKRFNFDSTTLYRMKLNDRCVGEGMGMWGCEGVGMCGCVRVKVCVWWRGWSPCNMCEISHSQFGNQDLMGVSQISCSLCIHNDLWTLTMYSTLPSVPVPNHLQRSSLTAYAYIQSLISLHKLSYVYMCRGGVCILKTFDVTQTHKC